MEQRNNNYIICNEFYQIKDITDIYYVKLKILHRLIFTKLSTAILYNYSQFIPREKKSGEL